MDFDEVVIIPIVAILMPLILVPTIIRMKHAARLREYAHRERMRALEMGVMPPDSMPGGLFWPSLAAVAIGAFVPLGSFLVAWLAALTTHAEEEVWLCAGVVGVTAVLCGTGLGFRMIGCGSSGSSACSDHHAKPAHFDPDAFDTVGRRG